MMKVLVSVKRVLDYNIKARVKADESGVDLANVKMSMNPFDEIAVEEAVRLKEAGTVKEIVVVSIGAAASQETIRSALALGGDRGILVKTDATLRPLQAAKILQAVCQEEKPDFVLMGKQAIDDDANQTGQMLAGLLGWSQGTFASEIQMREGAIGVTREVDGGLETLLCTLPAVVTTDLRLNVPRYPKLPNIMKAKRKPLDVRALEDMGLSSANSQKTLRVSEPPQRQGGHIVPDVDGLIDALKNEKQVI